MHGGRNAERKRLLQILRALSRKVAFGPDVDLAALAEATDGFSGADLQALVYNAHLEVVHDAIADLPTGEDKTNTRAGPDAGPPVKYTVLGGQDDEGGRVLSRAEESAFQRRVRARLVSDATQRREVLRLGRRVGGLSNMCRQPRCLV